MYFSLVDDGSGDKKVETANQSIMFEEYIKGCKMKIGLKKS